MSLSKKRCTLLITGVDNYIPFCIALSLIECLKDSSAKVKTVVTAQDTDNKLVRELRKKGAEVREICYDDRRSVEDAVRGANVMVFFPEHDEERVRQARELADAANNEEQLCGVLVGSIEGAGEGKRQLFRDYCEIEKIWKKETKSSERCVCVVRPAFLQDMMELWAPHVEDRGTFNMTPSPQRRFAPLAMKDFAHVIYEILAKAHDKTVIQIDRRHHNKCYTLTGPKSISLHKMIEIVNDAIGEEGTVEYEQVSEEELEEYLRNLRREERRGTSVWYGLNRSKRAIAKLINDNRKVDKRVRKFFDGLECAEDAVRRLERRNRGRQPVDKYRYNTRDDYRYSTRDDNRYNTRDDNRYNNRRQQDLQARRIDDIMDALDRLRHCGLEDANRLNINERTRLANDVKRELNRIADNLRRSGFEEEGRHEHKYPSIPLPLRPIEVECALDILHYIEEGCADRVTDDVERIIHREPQSIAVWFEDNSQDFVPRNCELCGPRCDCNSHANRRRNSNYYERRSFRSRI
ncbi:4848_t:CDS:2 [Paraglomus occultum]|uniref:4848_t:CDS:1 n=1 Tax=Paraglomus occultum TaxID=144539 RepID=A0A9N8ZLP1_9GLOM|nr:4848_t:CDS:2 [Paraglomus occultum]